jgi:hypothetical protein
VKPQPFKSASEAWFWCVAALVSGCNGEHYDTGGRPYEPHDIISVLETLYRRRRIDLVHTRILRIWGERQVAPNPNCATERCDSRLWAEALGRLEWPLRVKGIVR